MKLFVVVNVVEGLFNSVEIRRTSQEAVDYAVELAAEQCDSGKNEIRKELEVDRAFLSRNRDIGIHIAECELPEDEVAVVDTARKVVEQRMEGPKGLGLSADFLEGFREGVAELVAAMTGQAAADMSERLDDA